MAWIESHTVLTRHRKIIELAKDLRLKPVYVLGHLHALWHAALEQQEDGDLSVWSDSFIAESACYEGDAPQFVSLLQKHKWLDGRKLHDWWNYAGKYITSKYRNSDHEKLSKMRENATVETIKGALTTPLERPIHAPHKTTIPNLTQPNTTKPNQTKQELDVLFQQNDVLLSQYDAIKRERIEMYLKMVALKNRSKEISPGRKNTLLSELASSRSRCNNDQIFMMGIEACIDRNACCIGYVNAVIKNKKTERPR